MSKKICAALFLAVASCCVCASWETLGTTEGNSIYADPTTKRKVGNIVKMWSLIELKSPQKLVDGKIASSKKEQSEYDCQDERSRSLYSVNHEGSMGAGAVVSTSDEPGKWQPVPPNSVNEALLRYACDAASVAATPAAAVQSNIAASQPQAVKAVREIPPSPSTTDSVGLFGGWIKGTMVNTSTGDELQYEIEKSRGKGGMWAADPKTGEVFRGQYSGKYTSGGYSFGSISGTDSSGLRKTQNLQVFTPPTSANAQGFLKGDMGTVLEVFLEIKPSIRPSGFGKGVDNKGNQYQVQF